MVCAKPPRFLSSEELNSQFRYNMSNFLATKTTRLKMWNDFWSWQVAPCTLAVVTGPLVTTIHRVTGSPDVQVGNLSLAQMLRGLLCLTMVLSLFLCGRLRLLYHPLIRPLIFMSTYAMVTLLVAAYPYENIVFAVKLIFVSLVFANAYHLGESGLCSEYWLTLSAWTVLLFMVTSQAIGLATGHAVPAYKSSYATAGLIDQPALTAALIVSTLPIFLRFFLDGRWSVLGVLLLLMSLFFTMRRTELAAALAALFVVGFRLMTTPQSRASCRRIALAILLISPLAAAVPRTQAGADLLARIRELNPREGTGSGRYSFWAVSVDHIVHRPIGAQIGGEGMERIRDIIEEDLGQSIGAHDDWLALTHAFGMFGLAAIVWWYFKLMRFTAYLRKLKDPAFQGVLSTLVIFIIISIGQGGFYDPSLTMMYAALGFWAGRSYYWELVYYA